MPYESKDARLIFTTPAERDAHERAVEAANRLRGIAPKSREQFSAWNKAWTETYAKERANG